jgi:hypothetical protein
MPIKRGETLRIPDDPAILAAVGKVALRHGQLDHVLRMTVKIILQLSRREALDATARQGSWELRARVRKLAKQKIGEGEAFVHLDALLERSRRATDRRNEFLHRVWAYGEDGNPIIHDDDHRSQPIPSVEDLEAVATEFAHVAFELNEARLNGFLREALLAAAPQKKPPPGS